ncbi:hypothetical protein [Acinetobacter indicus]|uniref:hypothetical protein n=1 Tax=Acinetobacter indicus TaxID=756892 RepID=UPI001D1810B9|nr:hypothetical protein [Acinetobacter indicus]
MDTLHKSQTLLLGQGIEEIAYDFRIGTHLDKWGCITVLLLAEDQARGLEVDFHVKMINKLLIHHKCIYQEKNDNFRNEIRHEIPSLALYMAQGEGEAEGWLHNEKLKHLSLTLS